MGNKYVYAIGRRKTASAQIKLYEGKGDITINGKKAQEYISRSDLFDTLYSPLKVCGVKDNFYFDAKVSGSGNASQIGAIRLALSRALSEQNSDFRPLLKAEGFLIRDARKVERKKPGRHKARKAIQWSKR